MTRVRNTRTLILAAALFGFIWFGFLAFSCSCSEKGKSTRPPAVNDTIPPQVSVVRPNGSEVFYVGSQDTIRWVATDNLSVDSVNLYYSTDGGSTFTYTIATGEPNDSMYVWTIPSTLSSNCKVKAVAYDPAFNQAGDTSDNTFSITALDSTTVTYGFNLINAYPHDTAAWTQGLVFENDTLYEGTGLIGYSSIRKVQLETGAILQIRRMTGPYFGEGITIWQDKIFQLTWRSHVGFIYDRASFDSLGRFYYPHEGWGITHDGTRLIVSDGTSRLRFWNPLTLTPIDSIDVYEVRPDATFPVPLLNELEYVDGKIYANVWQSDMIAIISPQTGKVEAWIELTELVAREDGRYAPSDVLNGIAYDDVNDRLFVTGKYWPEVFEITIDVVRH